MRPAPTGRRDFLLGSAALAAWGASAPLASARDDDEFAPLEPVRVGVVGTGGRGCDLIRALATIDGAELVAVCDDYEPHLKRGEEYAGPRARPFRDLATMLREARPAAVVIATPLDCHYGMSLAALDAGAAVFCEKTLCLTLDECRKLAQAVADRRAIFQVGIQRRFNAIYKQAAAMVAAGMLGRISAIECRWHRHTNGRRPVPVPRADPRFPDLEHRLNWRLFRARSQGLMSELASHQLDIANWVLGGPPTRAIGTGGIDHDRDGRDVFDNVHCLYEYQTKPPAALRDKGGPYTVRVTYSSLQNNAYEGASETILGSKGTLYLTQAKGLFYRETTGDGPGWDQEAGVAVRDAAIITSGKTLKMSNDPWAHRGTPYEIEASGDDTRDQLVAFLDSARRKDPATLCDARAGLLNAATILIGHEAMTEGRAVDFPEGLA
ncbi:Gfo/Idh/MocA family protein [Tundrisphaera sp. TA3]|uniref:Gfo/Idh/MocA family protein n=1 Tax=Tundrisphaera sp. TA3 TaxID=3435775 RepID=UPI003EBA53C2